MYTHTDHANTCTHTRTISYKLTKTDNRSCNYTVAVQPRVNNTTLKRGRLIANTHTHIHTKI